MIKLTVLSYTSTREMSTSIFYMMFYCTHIVYVEYLHDDSSSLLLRPLGERRLRLLDGRVILQRFHQLGKLPDIRFR